MSPRPSHTPKRPALNRPLSPVRGWRLALLRSSAVLAVTSLAAAALAPVGPAWADEATERATAKAIKAQALFKSGQFIKAAEAFLEAYAVSPKATMLFNAARAYEEAAALDEAIALYQRYLTLKDSDAAGRADATKRLADLTQRRAAASAPADAPVASPKVPAGHVVPAPLPGPASPPRVEPAGTATPLPGKTANPPIKADPAELAEAKRGEVAALRDVDAEVSGPMWFLLGCFVIGLPLAYLSEPAPTPSRMLGKSDAWVVSYAGTFRRVATARHKDMAVYGCLTGAAVTLILGAAAN